MASLSYIISFISYVIALCLGLFLTRKSNNDVLRALLAIGLYISINELIILPIHLMACQDWALKGLVTQELFYQWFLLPIASVFIIISVIKNKATMWVCCLIVLMLADLFYFYRSGLARPAIKYCVWVDILSLLPLCFRHITVLKKVLLILGCLTCLFCNDESWENLIFGKVVSLMVCVCIYNIIYQYLIRRIFVKDSCRGL